MAESKQHGMAWLAGTAYNGRRYSNVLTALDCSLSRRACWTIWNASWRFNVHAALESKGNFLSFFAGPDGRPGAPAGASTCTLSLNLPIELNFLFISPRA